MAKKVEGTFADPWKPTEIGDTLEGTYLGAQDAMGDRGPFKAYHVKTKPSAAFPSGQRLSISGAGLNTIMPQIPRKTEITFTYKGTEKTKKGDMKVFGVEVPDDTVLLDPFDNDDDSE